MTLNRPGAQMPASFEVKLQNGEGIWCHFGNQAIGRMIPLIPASGGFFFAAIMSAAGDMAASRVPRNPRFERMVK